MNGAQFFTKFDASNGYWQIPADNESSDLLTFATTFGRYKSKRMPYEIHSASEIFQLILNRVHCKTVKLNVLSCINIIK